MGKQQRDKGARGEREVAALFHDMGWDEAKRELSQYQSSLGRDLSGTAPFCVQVKNDERANGIAALLEAEEAVDNLYAFPVSFVKKNGRWFVTMSAELFMDFTCGCVLSMEQSEHNKEGISWIQIWDADTTQSEELMRQRKAKKCLTT